MPPEGEDPLACFPQRDRANRLGDVVAAPKALACRRTPNVGVPTFLRLTDQASRVTEFDATDRGR